MCVVQRALLYSPPAETRLTVYCRSQRPWQPESKNPPVGHGQKEKGRTESNIRRRSSTGRPPLPCRLSLPNWRLPAGQPAVAKTLAVAQPPLAGRPPDLLWLYGTRLAMSGFWTPAGSGECFAPCRRVLRTIPPTRELKKQLRSQFLSKRLVRTSKGVPGNLKAFEKRSQ